MLPCGLTPSMAKHSQKLWDDIWLAIEEAEEAGLSSGCMVSCLEFIKAAVIRDHFDK